MHSYWTDKRVLITGATGFVGRHLIAALETLGCHPVGISSSDYDLRHPGEVYDLFEDVAGIDVLFHLAANVGGIGANQKSPADMYADNVLMDTHLIQVATSYRVGCFVGMGSVCAYPKHAPIPFKETDLWDGYPEETNAAYGMAKRGMLTCLQAYGMQYGLNWRYALSTNLYGVGDNYNLESGHVIASLVKRFSDAIKNGDDFITLWGTGKATRDFLYVEDVVSGLMTLAEHGTSEPVNLGSGAEVSIAQLADEISYQFPLDELNIDWDTSKPDGQPRRVLDITHARALGWKPRFTLSMGLKRMVNDYAGRLMAYAYPA